MCTLEIVNITLSKDYICIFTLHDLPTRSMPTKCMGATIFIGVSFGAMVLIFFNRISKSAICKLRSCNIKYGIYNYKNCYIGMNFKTAYTYHFLLNINTLVSE